VVKLEAENMLPYDSQLFFFNSIGLLLFITKDKKLQQDTLKAPHTFHFFIIIILFLRHSYPHISLYSECGGQILGASGGDIGQGALQAGHPRAARVRQLSAANRSRGHCPQQRYASHAPIHPHAFERVGTNPLCRVSVRFRPHGAPGGDGGSHRPVEPNRPCRAPDRRRHPPVPRAAPQGALVPAQDGGVDRHTRPPVPPAGVPGNPSSLLPLPPGGGPCWRTSSSSSSFLTAVCHRSSFRF
jgi:hypothetical protein